VSESSNQLKSEPFDECIELFLYNALGALLDRCPSKGDVRRSAYFLLEVYHNKKFAVLYAELVAYRFGDLKCIDRLLDSLIKQNYIHARCVGLKPGYLPKSVVV